MPLDYDQVMASRGQARGFTYDARDSALYALAVGMARDPMDGKELPFVAPTGPLKTVPSMAAILEIGNGIHAALPVNQTMTVHGEQRLKLYRPIPVAATIDLDSRVTHCLDKGEGRGALVIIETEIRLQSGEPLCTLGVTVFARADGGFGGPASGGPVPAKVPDRAPDFSVTAETQPNQALLYRLTGDPNPIHFDPAIAAQAGFPRPILHGLCTYGTTCRALLGPVCDYDSDRIASFDARFAAPVFPGETLAVDAWREDGSVAFQAKVRERDLMVLSHGRLTLRD